MRIACLFCLTLAFPSLARAEANRVPLAKGVALEVEDNKRRVIVETKVCLRQGQLEQLLTRRRTKEHEAILVADVDGREIHKALLLAGAEPGAPIQFQPKLVPPSGTSIKVFVEYQENGKKVRRPAQEWIRDIKTRKPLTYEWVFAGSRLFQDPNQPNEPPYYLANDGDLICVANFDSAMLDLPVDSSKDNANLSFEAWTERIPAIDTPVTLILEPEAGAQKSKVKGQK
jgi:hypothetical protein